MDSTVGASGDDEVNLGDTLAYDKEPKYIEEEVAAGISYTSVDRKEETASLETK